MTTYNTGNPLGSTDPRDLYDNAENLDDAVNSSKNTFQDRLGKSRLTWAGIVKSGSGDPAIAVDAAARAEAAASDVENNAEQIAQDAAEQAAQDVVAGVDGQVALAESAADRAEAASDSAFVNADVYPDIATGLAAVVDGEQFQVVEGDEIARYRRDSASTQTEMARFPAAHFVRGISAKLPTMLRQVDSIAEGMSVTSISERFLVSEDAGASIYRTTGNLYNPLDAVEGWYIVRDTGNTSYAEGWAHSADITVTPDSKISFSSNAPRREGIAFYTSDGTPILPVDNSVDSPLTITVPDSAAYMRFNVKSDVLPEPSEIMVNFGEPLDFIPFGQKLAVKEDTLLSSDAIDSFTETVSSRNLLDPARIYQDKLIRSTPPHDIYSTTGWAVAALPVTPGKTYSIYSPSGAPRRNGAAFYASDDPITDASAALEGSYNSASSAVTLTAPAGAKTLGVAVQSSTVPMPDDLMVIEGDDFPAYEAYGSRLVVKQSAVYPPVSAPDSRGPLSITINPTAGQASQVRAGELTRSFVAIPRQTVLSYPVRFSIAGTTLNGSYIRGGGDDIAPDHIDGATVGANHGYSIGEVSAAGHGKTVADCGSVWVSGGVEAVLADVLDANRLLMARVDANTAPPSGAYTHVSGAANTGSITVTAVTARQWYPPHNNHSITILADGQKIEPGEHTAESVQFIERADILARADIINAWIANGGIPGGYEPDAPASISESITYRYDRRAQLTIAKSWLFTKEITVRDLMGLQMGAGDAETYIIPGSLPFNYQGSTVDYSQGVLANNTLASGVSVFMDSSNLQSAGEYANRVLAVYPDAILAIGFLPVGDAAPDERRSRVSNAALEIRGNTGKVYFRVLDKGTHVAEVGDSYSVCSYRFVLPRSNDRTAFYAVEGGGATWVYADWHDKSELDRLPIDEQYPELIGKSYEVIEARNVTAKGGIVAGQISVIVSAASSSATLILKVT